MCTILSNYFDSRQRRIKCDELRPSCTQCRRSRKDCGGYPPPPRAKIFEEIRIAPKPGAGHVISTLPDIAIRTTPSQAPQTPNHSAPSSALSRLGSQSASERDYTPPQTPRNNSLELYRPSTISFDSTEGQYFQLFRERTAGELSGFFDSSFWTRSVLQEFHSEEPIRHSVVALGALYKTLENISESPPGSPTGIINQTSNVRRHWAIAVHHYALAMKFMRASTSQDHASQRTSLMATVLLACFDSFVGDHKQAISQIQNGLKLLEMLRAQRRNSFVSKPEEPVEQDLVQMFTRLAIQAKSYDMAFHFPRPFVIRLTPEGNAYPMSPTSDGGSPVLTEQSPIPEIFPSLIEARQAWDTLCESTMRFTETMFSVTTARSPMGVLPNSLRQYSKGFGEKLSAWSRAFEPILVSRSAPAKSSQEKTAIAVLKMNQVMGEILFSMTYSDTELQFDTYISHFKEITSLAMEVIGDEERRAAAKRCPNPQWCHHNADHLDGFDGQYTARHIKPSFSADLGIVPPLFVVATKCRDQATRHQAIQLLRTSSRREGMWDSELSARIGMWVAEIEEEDGVDLARPTTSSTERTDRSRASVSPSTISRGSFDFADDLPLGPGGNARWDGRRESATVSSYAKRIVPEERRVMVRSVEFDLRKRTASLSCGTRGLIPGMKDPRTRTTRIVW